MIVLPCLYKYVRSCVSLYMQYTCQTGWVIAHLFTVRAGVVVVVTGCLVIVQISGGSEKLACEQNALAKGAVSICGTRCSNGRTHDVLVAPHQRAVRSAAKTYGICSVTSE